MSYSSKSLEWIMLPDSHMYKLSKGRVLHKILDRYTYVYEILKKNVFEE